MCKKEAGRDEVFFYQMLSEISWLSVTPAEIVEMHRLYAQFGSYAEVGRQIGRGGSTDTGYIKAEGTPPIVKHTFSEGVWKGDKKK